MPTEARKHEMLALLEVSGSKLFWKVVPFLVLGLGQILLDAGHQMVSVNTHAPNSRHNAAVDSGAQIPL